MQTPRLTVVGSINLDFVVRAERLPRPGETVSGARFARVPGGKGANQAVAAARLGAQVRMVGCVGRDELAQEALAGLREAHVEEGWLVSDAPTGVALITVDAGGETTIVVAPGANAELRPTDLDLGDADAVLCQQEIPAETVARVAELAPRFFLNAAPAREGAPDAELTVVNRLELDALGERRGLVCLTLGAEGAVLLQDGEEVARAEPPAVEAVDGTGAGDAFTACLVVSLLEGRPRDEALRRACAAGALAASRFGAQTFAADGGGGGRAAVTTPIVIDCDPGHDDAMAILLALASPEVDLVGVTTVAGNQTLDKTTRNALVTLEIGGRSDIPVAAGADAPLRRELRTAAHVHGETGLDGPELPEPSARAVDADPGEWLEPGVVLVATAPLTNVARWLERGIRPERIVWMGGAIGEGNVTPAAEFNAFVDPEAAAAVFASGIPIAMVGLDVTHKALFTRAHAERLRDAGRAGRFVAELSDFFQAFHERSYGFGGSPIHDAMAVAHVIDPTLLSTRHVNVAVETSSELCDGRTVVDLRGVTGREPNAEVGVDVDADRFLELLVSRIASLP